MGHWWEWRTARRGWPTRALPNRPRHVCFVSEHLRAVAGFLGAQLLRREEAGEVAFTSITWFTGLDAVRGFAGDDYERAVVEPAAQTVLTRWDKQVAHHEVAFDLPPSGR